MTDKPETAADVLAVMRYKSPELEQFADRIERALSAQAPVATVCLTPSRYAHGTMLEVQLQVAPGTQLRIGDKLYTTPPPEPKPAAVEVAMALDYSRNFAAANPSLSNTTREHILGLCALLERVAGSRPAAEVTDAMTELACEGYLQEAKRQGFRPSEAWARSQQARDWMRAALTAALQEGRSDG